MTLQTTRILKNPIFIESSFCCLVAGKFVDEDHNDKQCYYVEQIFTTLALISFRFAL